MIMILDKGFKPIKTVRNEEDLFCYLTEQESFKPLGKNARNFWRFNQYSHQLLATFLKDIQDKAFLLMARQACYLESDIICVHKGEWGGASFYIATQELDLARLKADWCKEYLSAHNLYTVRG